MEAAGKLKGKVVMVVAKTESDNGKPIIDYFGLDKSKKEPQVIWAVDWRRPGMWR